MNASDPDCTCPTRFRRIPHNGGCPRFGEDRAWSIADRQDRMRQRLGTDLDNKLGKILGGVQ